MRVLILAAGTGSRLGARTADLPKPALVVGGHPLLHYDMRFARQAGADEVVVITGYRQDISEPLARALGADRIVWNPRFADAGNLISLTTARDAGCCDQGFLLMNADHVYHPGIAHLVAHIAATATHVTGFIDHDRVLGADDMKVRLAPDRTITAIAKTLDTFDAGYVGMTYVPPARLAQYFQLAEEAHRELGDAIHVESILARLATGPDRAHTADISGHGWLEVDDERDFARAEAAFADAARAGAPWYP